MATVDDLKRHMGAVFSDNYESLNQFCLIVLNSLAWQFATGRGFYLTPAERSGFGTKPPRWQYPIDQDVICKTGKAPARIFPVDK